MNNLKNVESQEVFTRISWQLRSGPNSRSGTVFFVGCCDVFLRLFCPEFGNMIFKTGISLFENTNNLKSEVCFFVFDIKVNSTRFS